MSWHIKSTGTIADIQAALNALVVDDEIEAQQFATVKEVFNNSVGQGSTTPDVVVPNTFLYGVTNAEDSKLQLIASGRMDGRVSWVNYNLSVVKLIPQNAIIGTVHPIPFDTTTITQGGGGGGEGLIWGPDPTTLDGFEYVEDSNFGVIPIDSLTFNGLTTVTNAIFIEVVSLVELDFPDLTTTDGVHIANCPLLQSVDFGSAGLSIGQDFEISGCVSLTSVDAAPLQVVGDDFSFGDNPLLASVDFSSVQSVGAQMYGANNIALTAINLSSLTTTGEVAMAGCTLLVSVLLPLWVPTDGTGIDFSNCALNATTVQQILRRCVLAGVTTCTINLSGGTSAGTASLNAQGQADVVTLGAQLTINA